MITLLAESAYQEWWWGAPGLYTLIALGGLIAVTIMLIVDVVRWFRTGEASFWWRHGRRLWVQKPRDWD